MSTDEYQLYVVLMAKNPDLPFTKEVIDAHVEHIKELDRSGRLVLCGPFLDWDGGMIVLRAESMEEARATAEADPFIQGGFETVEVRTLHHACKENNYLLDG